MPSPETRTTPSPPHVPRTLALSQSLMPRSPCAIDARALVSRSSVETNPVLVETTRFEYGGVPSSPQLGGGIALTLLNSSFDQATSTTTVAALFVDNATQRFGFLDMPITPLHARRRRRRRHLRVPQLFPRSADRRPAVPQPDDTQRELPRPGRAHGAGERAVPRRPRCPPQLEIDHSRFRSRGRRRKL
jgi:hypothetical protein